MKRFLPWTFLVVLAPAANAADAEIKWLVQYEAKALPQEQGWKAQGKAAARAELNDGALRVVDDSAEELGNFRATWTPDPAREVVVEARLRTQSVEPNHRRARMGFEEGAPISLLVSDGRRQEGLIFYPDKISSFLDRFHVVDTRGAFHTYRLVIRGGNMSVYVDGILKIRGEGAFWKPAESTEAFIQFGSSSPGWKGEARWSSVRLGLREAAPVEKPKLRITVSAPWDIPRPAGVTGSFNRPFVHHVGSGLLLMNVAQGADAIFAARGLLKSTDEGRTWEPVKDLQLKAYAPIALIRRPDRWIAGVSRWTAKSPEGDGIFVGMSYLFDPEAQRFSMFENQIRVPDGMMTLAINRIIGPLENGGILATADGATAGGAGRFRSFLITSNDGGAVWTHFATLGSTTESTVVRLSPTEMTAVMRTNGRQPLVQAWSHDGGKSWGRPVPLEEGSVDPNLVLMSNGVVACSYGRPGSNLMFSADGAKTWGYHQVITDKAGFNYTAIREVRPGRLLYVHDAPRLQALYVDVERLEN